MENVMTINKNIYVTNIKVSSSSAEWTVGGVCSRRLGKSAE